MKYLTLIRHAKSSWKDTGCIDFDRQLSKRGTKDGPRMNAWLKKSHVSPDIVLCSPTVRAAATLAMLTHLSESAGETRVVEEIYEASLFDLLSLLGSVPDTFSHCCVIGHNPGLQELAQYLSDTPVEPLVTCAVVQLKLDVSSWEKIKVSCGTPVVFMTPKLLKDGNHA